MPSFQSPEPMSGRPCSPYFIEWAIARTACSKTGADCGDTHGHDVGFVLVGLERRRLEERHRPRRARIVAGPLDVAGQAVRQPEEVVGAARPRAAAARRMPPVLHVALDELARRCEHEVCAAQLGPRIAAARARPAADRGTRRPRPADTGRCGPRCGSSRVWYSSQRFTIRSKESSGVRTWSAPRQSSHIRSVAASAASTASSRP